MNPALHSLRRLHSLRPAFYHPYSRSLHPPRRALFTAFVAAATAVTILLPAVWVLQWMS